MSESLDVQLSIAVADVADAARRLDLAQRRRDEARSLGGGLLGFGGSGPQAAARTVRDATDRAVRDWMKAATALDEAQLRFHILTRAIEERDRVRLTRDDIDGATHIRTRRGWWTVVRVNAKTVTVETGHSWTDRIPFDKVLEARREATP